MLRWLIVDDSPCFLEAARGLLERQGIMVVGVASNGAEALRLAEELRPDVTLLDIDLGGESGLELARRRRGEAQLHACRFRLRCLHELDPSWNRAALAGSGQRRHHLQTHLTGTPGLLARQTGNLVEHPRRMTSEINELAT
jgi:CheY-like chemotaxis protein